METRVENGDARDVICSVAQKLVPDVLVMGSDGYGLIKRYFKYLFCLITQNSVHRL